MNQATTGFALAAAIAILFNTALAWTKDAYAPFNSFMKSLTGHHWTTHGLADLVLFLGLGILFTKTNLTGKLNPNHVVTILAVSVLIASLGLGLWYLLF